MKITKLGLWISSLVFLGGCSADPTSTDPASEVPASNGPAAASDSPKATLVGSYDLPNDGRLDFYELAPGDFLIGELFRRGAPDTGAVSHEAIDGESLPEIYRRHVGPNVPQELLRAEERRLAAVAGRKTQVIDEQSTDESGLSEPVPAGPGFASYEPPGDLFQAKEVDHAVSWFQWCHCRGLGTNSSTKTFNHCYTEVTGSGTQYQEGARGYYSAVYVFHGSLTYQGLYTEAGTHPGWSLAFTQPLSEGQGYRYRKVFGAISQSVAARISDGEGDGFNLSLIGTSQFSSRNCYSSFSDIACVTIAGCP
jgi:hypothetical protein